MILVRITIAPKGRDGHARPIEPTVTHYYALGGGKWELLDHDDGELMAGDPGRFRRHTWVERDEAQFTFLEAAITSYIRRYVKGANDLTEAQLTTERGHLVFWVTYPRSADLTAELITHLPELLFEGIPDQTYLEFIIEPLLTQ